MKMEMVLKITLKKINMSLIDSDIQFLEYQSKICIIPIMEKCQVMLDLETPQNQELIHGQLQEQKKQKRPKKKLTNRKKSLNLKLILKHLNKMSNLNQNSNQEQNKLQEKSLMPMEMVLKIIEQLLDIGWINSIMMFMDPKLMISTTPTMVNYPDMRDIQKIQHLEKNGFKHQKQRQNSFSNLKITLVLDLKIKLCKHN